jgi:glycosyltransferase involved in cell wall biosynthesis
VVTRSVDEYRKGVLNGAGILLLLFSMCKLIKNGFDLFHFNSSKKAYPYILCVFLLKLLGKKVILSLHHGEYNTWLKKYKWRKRFYIFILQFADRIIFMNKDDAKVFKDISGYDDFKINNISPYIVPNDKYFKLSYERKGNLPHFMVTTMGLWKNYYLYEDVIDACINFSKEYSKKIILDIIVGTISIDIKYRKKIFNLVKQESNSMCGINIIEDKDDVLEYLKGRDVLVRSSKVDSYGICIAEALLVGTPAVATNVCPRPVNTQLYKPHDIKELTGCLKEIEQNRKNIISHSSLITKEDDSYFQLENIYQELI